MWDFESVKDWTYRVQNYPPEVKQFYLDMVPKVNEMKGIISSKTGWSNLLDSKSD